MNTRRAAGAAALTAYAAAIYGANYTTSRYGMVPVAPGLTVTAGTYAAGLALLLRDAVHETLGRAAVFAGILAGAILTALTAPDLAAASATAFLFAEVADWAVYGRMRGRGWAVAALASGAVGAVIDSVLFLTIAGFPVTWASVAGQWIGKTVWATALPVLVALAVWQVRRVVPRYSLGA